MTDFGILVALAYQEFVHLLRADLAERGFTDLARSDAYVFRALDAESLTITELADRLGVTKQAASQVVDDTRRRGYLERRPDPRDGRAWRLALTARGVEALAASRRFHAAYEERLAREHGADRVAVLRALLSAMAGAGTESDPRLRALYV
jgi:DNA-binding MarR family transcriptional regulator